MKPLALSAAAALLAAGLAAGGEAASFGSAECLGRATDAANAVTYTNVCRSLIHVGRCTSARGAGEPWSCDHLMYSPGESFSVAGDRVVKIRACRADLGNCVRAVRCIGDSRAATETAVLAAAAKCGVEF